jgi:peptidoglycan/xylan/chitin deacetylase (PgdA/CDA1 family)
MRLRTSIAAKGPRGFAERVGTIATRFGPTPARMESRLREFGDLAGQCGVSPTFPITAVVVGRSSRTVRQLQEEGVEFAIHGLVHNDHLEMSGAQQAASIARAKQIFERAGVETHGFRAPYLRANGETLAAVHDNGLDYDSSRAVAFPVLPAELTAACDGYRRALGYYRALEAQRVASRPHLDAGLVTIPVSIPDDEIMIDRLHLADDQQAQAWSHVLDLTYDRGELFTIQLHPERIRNCRAALTAVLADARTRPEPVWFANLGDITRWWRRRATARIDITEADDGSFRATLVGPPDARLVLRTTGRTEVPVDGTTVRLDRRPVVGVPRRSPEKLSDFLREEGYVVQVGPHPDEVGAYVRVHGPDFDQIDVLRQVAAGQGPVVRVARWPDGRRSAFAISGDIDALTLGDFFHRYAETRTSAREDTALAARQQVAGAIH